MCKLVLVSWLAMQQHIVGKQCLKVLLLASTDQWWQWRSEISADQRLKHGLEGVDKHVWSHVGRSATAEVAY